MNKTKKLFCGLLAGVLAANGAASLAACGGGNGSVGNIVAYNGSEVTVTFYHTMGADLKGILDEYIPVFNELYPNITIVHDMMGDYPALRDQIATELTANNSPSLAYCYPDHVALYNKSRKVLPLDDYIASEDKVTLADGTETQMGFTQAQIDDFIDAYYDEGKAYGDGKMYTLPMVKSTEVLYYNKTYFTENNLTVPKTWDEMEQVCATIKSKEGANVIPLGYDSEANWFITMTEQLGTPYTSSGDDKFLFNTAENRAFVERFRSWYKNGYVTTEELSGDYTSSLFTQTDDTKLRCYMCIGSSAGARYQCPEMETQYDENGDEIIDENTGAPVMDYPFEVGVAMIPQSTTEQANDMTKAKVIQQGPSLCLFKKADSQEMAAAWLFAKFLTTNVSFQAKFSMKNGYTSVIESVRQDEDYADTLAAADGNENLQATCVLQTLAQMDAYYVSPAFNGSSAARNEVGRLLQACFSEDPSGNQSVADFIAAQFKKTIDTLEFDYGF